jgi:Malectin domain
MTTSRKIDHPLRPDGGESEQYSTRNNIGDRHEQHSVSYAVPYLTTMGKMEDVELATDDTESSEGSWVNDGEVDGKDPKQKSKRCFVSSVIGLMLAFTIVLVGSTLHLYTGGKDKGYQENLPALAKSFVVRISTGASEIYRDLNNNEWYPNVEDGTHDDYSVTGEGDTYDKCPTPIANAGTYGEGLYCNERFFKTEGRYEIPVPDTGAYQVILHFADIFYNEEKERVFDVLLEDQVVEENYDIVKEVGSGFAAIRITRTIDITDGSVSILLRSEKDYAKISGIEVLGVANFINDAPSTAP